MMNIPMRKLLILLIFPLLTLTSKAQNNVIDEVIWIVGDDAILKSEVEEQKIRAQYEGTKIEGDPYCVIPEQIAINKLFLHQAELDSIEVSESNVMTEVDYYLNQYIAQAGSREKFEEYVGKKVSQYREDLRLVIKERNIINQMKSKLVENIKSTPAEIRRFYKSLSTDSIPTVPAQVELQIISFEPAVPIDEVNRIKNKLRDFTERVNSGTTDFSVLARLYSEDTESAKKGGEMDFMGKGELVPEFADVAFNLTNPKKVSRIVQTEFGFHIIQLIEKRGDRLKCRHILLKPRVSLDDKGKAILRLDSVSDLIRKEKMTFEQAVIYFSQDKNTAMNAGLMLNRKTGTSKFEYQDLPQEVAKIVYNMQIGEISKPFSMIDPSLNKEVVAVVKLKSKVDNHKANMIDDYQLLKNIYEEKEKNDFIQNWISKKQKETYISIDPKWQNCNFQYPGWNKK